MMHIVQKWQIVVNRSEGNLNFDIDEDFLGKVFEALGKFNFGINVTSIEVRRYNPQQSGIFHNYTQTGEIPNNYKDRK